MALERKSGHYSHDIRLSSSIIQQVHKKTAELGLDPVDTNPQELYFALRHRLAEDDAWLVTKLRTLAAKQVNASANLSDGLELTIKHLKLDQDCFCLKTSVLKRQIKEQLPKKTMKALSFRSVDSMLKSEPIALIMLAINYYESESYIHSFYNKYKHYSATDFETRPLSVMVPKSAKWQAVLEEIHQKSGLTLVSSYELASIIILPIDNQPKNGYLSVLLANLLNEASVIMSTSAYLKLNQVNSDFGLKLRRLGESEAYLDHSLLGQSVSWRSAQDILDGSNSEQFAPHLIADDLKPINLMKKLASVADRLRFWADNDFLALVQSAETTSLNILDVATSLVNDLPYEKRSLDHLRHCLHQELIKLYLRPENLINSLSANSKELEANIMADEQAQAVY